MALDVVRHNLRCRILGPILKLFSLAHQDWFEQFLELPNGVPSHDTFGRVFRCLDTAEFQACLSKWVEHLQFSLRGKTISIDGKTLRGSHDHASGQKPLHIVNAWAKHVNFCLGSISVDDKSNEIPAVQELLSILNLKVEWSQQTRCTVRRKR